MPRTRLGPLALESKLGDHPSQSIVWRAVHIDLHRAVAVKVFTTPFGGTLEGREAFAEEWEALKRLQHPAIARCYGGGFEETDMPSVGYDTASSNSASAGGSSSGSAYPEGTTVTTKTEKDGDTKTEIEGPNGQTKIKTEDGKTKIKTKEKN